MNNTTIRVIPGTPGLTVKPGSLKRGDQIAKVPPHANGDILHPDVEFGFVTSVEGDTVLCRYWQGRPLHHDDLRTKANSEATPKEYIIRYQSAPRSFIEHWLNLIDMGAA